jgi:hypothetical protein
MSLTCLTVSATEWALFNTQTFNRENFNGFLVFVIAPYLKKFTDIKGDINIKFPSTVSKVCRYNMHRLNNAHFKTMSYNETNNERIIEIRITKAYIEDLFRDYDFTEVVVPEQELIVATPLSDKQLLFSTLLEFIQTNLNEEFQNYLNTI